MRRAHRVDGPHAAIRDGLRGVPRCEVFDSSAFGDGFPDLLVSWRGVLYLLEVKDPARPNRFTDDEIAFRRRFGEHYFVVTSLDDALVVLGLRKVAA